MHFCLQLNDNYCSYLMKSLSVWTDYRWFINSNNVSTQLFLSISMGNTLIIWVKSLMLLESNMKLRGSFQKLKCHFCKINSDQFVLFYIGPTFRNKTPYRVKRTRNLNAFKQNLKKHFLNELKNYSFWNYFHFQL